MEELKKCSGPCGLWKPLSDFSWKYKAKGKKNSYCKVCHKEYATRHFQDNKADYDRVRDQRRADGKRDFAQEYRSAFTNLPPSFVKRKLAREMKLTSKDIPDYTVEPERILITQKREKQMSEINEEEKSPFAILNKEETPLTETTEVTAQRPIVYASNNTPLDNAFNDCQTVTQRLLNGSIDLKTADLIVRSAIAQSVIAGTQVAHDEKFKAGKLGRNIPAFTPAAQITETSNAHV